jgi:hypothetical protein
MASIVEDGVSARLRRTRRRANDVHQSTQSSSKRTRNTEPVQLQTPRRSRRTKRRSHTTEQRPLEAEIHVDDSFGAQVGSFIDELYRTEEQSKAAEDTFSPQKHVDKITARVSFDPRVDYAASPRTPNGTSAGEELSQSESAIPSLRPTQDVYDVPDEVEIGGSHPGPFGQQSFGSANQASTDVKIAPSKTQTKKYHPHNIQGTSSPFASGAPPPPAEAQSSNDFQNSQEGVYDPDLEVMRTIKPDRLDVMIYAMREAAWTGDGNAWTSELSSRGMNKDEVSRWMRAHLDGQPKAIIQLFRFCHVVWNVLDRAPSLAVYDTAAQIAFFQDPAIKRKLKMSLQAIQKCADDICNKRSYNTLQGLAQKVIPLLLLTLQAGFAMGSKAKLSKTKPVPTEARLNLHTVKVLIRITNWVEKLLGFVLKESNDRHLRRRVFLRRHIQCLRTCLVQKLEPEEPESVRVQRLAEKDQQARLEGQEVVRKQKDAQDRQMELFLASTQGMGRQGYTKKPKPQPHNRRSVFLSPRAVKQTSKLTPKQQYMLDNDGWSWEEDDLLLNLMQRAQNMNVQEAILLFPRHNNVLRRMDKLKARARRWHEERNRKPKPWCQ